MTKVGVIGLGMMGNTHLDVYAKRSDVSVVAVADRVEDRRTGKVKAGGNIEGQAKGSFDFSKVRQFAEGSDLIAQADVDLIDICVPTPQHAALFVEAVDAGKHVLTEKPVARTYAEAQGMVKAAASAKGKVMPAMCMRFWPGWTWLKEAIDAETYGKALSATFQRITSHPGGRFYGSGEDSGGAILDLHIHDTDFVQYCFGVPDAVTSIGYSKPTSAIDHVITQYHYANGPIVCAEGGWALADGYGFTMKYMVNFENATAVFDLAADPVLKLIEPGKEPRGVELDPELGYAHEIGYLLECIARNKPVDRVTIADAARAVRIVEAEVRSIEIGQRVAVGA